MPTRWIGLLMLVPLLGACATVPSGPSVMVLPGSGKSFEEFQADDAVCRQWAFQRTGITPGQAASGSGITSAAVGTVLGAAAGAAIGAAAGSPGLGAAAGAGGGLLLGSAAGVSGAQYSGAQTQQAYDMAYLQCMYAKGNQIPGAERAYRRGAGPPPPPPPPPPPAR
jgi:OmpA family protein